MWVILWVCFSAFVLAFVGWTMMVLFQQKATWKAFGKRHKLTYERGTLMGSPTVMGTYEDKPFSLFTGVQQTDDIRGQRFVTVMEFQMGKGMPTGAAISTKEFKLFINGLIFKQTMRPELAEWEDEYVVRTRDQKNLEAWFTKERQQVLNNLFKIKNAAVLFFFDEIEAVLRIETSDPLRNEAHLEKIARQISKAADVLAPKKEEKKLFKQLLEEEKSRPDDYYDDEDEDDDVDVDVSSDSDDDAPALKEEPEAEQEEKKVVVTKPKNPKAKKQDAPKKKQPYLREK